ncbi:hypothetical protein PENFLA_c027G01391 [Penicillium flavigenum]|uniref:Uncharacterized protein n=1 Tax=Penicillium flavigenum TaxID=254877 RepID=A0A1V6SR81_9EURO|nr:hypothetical protein PENFLA_c027G01391 [Penicillium flavigenum]
MQSAKADRPACLSPSLFVFPCIILPEKEASPPFSPVLRLARMSSTFETERKRYSYVRHTGTSARDVRVTSGHAESCAATGKRKLFPLESQRRIFSEILEQLTEAWFSHSPADYIIHGYCRGKE